MNNNDINNNKKNNNDSKKILTLIVLIATLMLGTTGATYAYFAINAVTNNTITGTAASASLSLTVTKTAPASNTGNMVPLLESALSNAISGSTSSGATSACVDSNNNVSCHVYTITIKNTSTAAVVVNGTITFSGSTNMPNLKWRKITNATTLGSNVTTAANVTTEQSLVSNLSLTASGSATYYIVVWINETGTAQTDTGTYVATIKFTSSNGTGVTSTITA